MKTTLSTKLALATLTCCSLASYASAQTTLYSENFDGESGNLTGGTTPEVNVGGEDRDLQATGATQALQLESGTTDLAWFTVTGSNNSGGNGLRFGATSYNWATGANSAAILADGGFSIAFDWNENGAAADNYFAVRVGSGGENSAVFGADVDLGVLVRAEGSASTFDQGVETAFANVDATTLNQVELLYEFDSWDAGTTVTLTAILNGSELGTDTFTWVTTDDVKIVFGSRYNGALVDNIVISTVPEPSSYALLAGILGLSWVMVRRRV